MSEILSVIYGILGWLTAMLIVLALVVGLTLEDTDGEYWGSIILYYYARYLAAGWALFTITVLATGHTEVAYLGIEMVIESIYS